MSICYCVGGQPTHQGLLHRKGPNCPTRRQVCDVEGHKVYLGPCAWCGLSEQQIEALQKAYEERIEARGKASCPSFG